MEARKARKGTSKMRCKEGYARDASLAAGTPYETEEMPEIELQQYQKSWLWNVTHEDAAWARAA